MSIKERKGDLTNRTFGRLTVVISNASGLFTDNIE